MLQILPVGDHAHHKNVVRQRHLRDDCAQFHVVVVGRHRHPHHRHALRRQRVRAMVSDRQPPLRQPLLQLVRLGGFHLHDRAVRQKLRHRILADHGALADHHQPVRGLLHLRKQMRRHHDRFPLLRQGADCAPHPAHPLRVQPIDGLIQNQVLRIPQQGGRHPHALLHAQRIAANPLVGSLRHAHHRQALLHPIVGNAGAAGNNPQMVPAAPVRVKPPGIQNRAGHRRLIAQLSELVIISLPPTLTAEYHPTLGGGIQTQHAPHCRGLPGTIRA